MRQVDVIPFELTCLAGPARRLGDEPSLHGVRPVVVEGAGEYGPPLDDRVETHEPGLPAREDLPGEDPQCIRAVAHELGQGANAPVHEPLLRRILGQELVLDRPRVRHVTAGQERETHHADREDPRLALTGRSPRHRHRSSHFSAPPRIRPVGSSGTWLATESAPSGCRCRRREPAGCREPPRRTRGPPGTSPRRC